MTRLERVFVWAGGGMFVTSLAVCGYFYLIVWERSVVRGVRLAVDDISVIAGGDAIPLGAIAIDALLVTVFAAHHSLFARDRVKASLAEVVPDRLLRSVYVWIASLLLILVCVAWRPIGGDLYDATGFAAVAHGAVQLAGVWIIARAVARIDALELAGIRPASVSGGLQTSGVYSWVRHPVYFGWVLLVFGAAHMTGDRLAFAVITTVYLVVAVPWEERSLMRTFGEDYAQYMRDVTWRMIPFIY
jgi:protein-S-isoprenylcysteine O-methyltransferase Ste14